MTSDTYTADVVIALAWLAMGTVASIWILAKLWRGGHRVVAWIRGGRL